MVNRLCLDVLSAGEALEFFLGSSLLVFVLELAALVVRRLALGEAEFDLGLAALEVDAQRHEREAALLKLGRQLANLASMKKQLAVAQRIDVVDGALLVRGDVDASKRHRAVAHDGVAVLKRAAPIAEGLNLRSLQRDAGFEDLFDQVFVPSFPVGGDNVRHGGSRLA